MGVFRQLGDPLAGAVCLCQHHGAVHCKMDVPVSSETELPRYTQIANGATIVQCQITITERCCVTANAALLTPGADNETDFEIERPPGTIRTTQEDSLVSGTMRLHHHASWEVLDPGMYTYFLVNRSGSGVNVYGAWLKIIASDCEG